MSHFRFKTSSDWFDIEATGLKQINGSPKSTLADVVFVHFDGTISGSMDLSGARSHASAVIERKLSLAGDVDGPVHVILHQITKLGSGYRVFYSAIPRSDLSQISVWSRNHKGNILIVDAMSFLWRQVGESEGVVSQIGNQLFFLAKYSGHVIYASTVAFSDAQEDLHAACMALVERVHASMIERDALAATVELKIQWAPMLAKRPKHWRHEDEVAVAERLFDQLAVTGNIGNICITNFKDGHWISVLPNWVTRSLFVRSLSSLKDRMLWLAGAYLRECAYVMMPMAIVGLIYALTLYVQAHEIHADISRMGDSVVRMEHERRQLEPKGNFPAGFQEWAKLIDTQHSLIREIDLNHVMNVVSRAAAESGVRVVRVYTFQSGKRHQTKGPDVKRIGVDGLLSSGAGVSDTVSLAKFVNALRTGGYEVSSEAPSPPPGSSGQTARTFTYALQVPVSSREEQR
ncbi:hypothetical protein AAB992_01250 [Burkholderia contaminans]|uniref:hypothetical protein n=1 Tax=Burkholderia contaminans TaxID=488447 RepID=UPI002417E652|nr:hypothetical protein [Burkholderia contaminans]WFN14919.1 hypothetical protein LXE92_32350 [Burkholderia contaminans]